MDSDPNQRHPTADDDPGTLPPRPSLASRKEGATQGTLRVPAEGAAQPGRGATARQFDWGPSAEAPFEGVKEWAIYGMVAFLLAVCGWFLLDLEKAPPAGPVGVVPPADQALNRPSAPLPASAGVMTPPPSSPQPAVIEEPEAPPTFFVQLGAFGDEDSAKLAMERLEKKGMVASLTIPNEQYEMYRLLMGPFRAESEAEKTARQLNELDFPSFVIESP